MSDEVLRLSPFVLPQVRQGLHVMTPQNLCVGTARIAHAVRLRNLVTAIASSGQKELARHIRDNQFLGAWLLTLRDGADGALEVTARPEFENALSLRPDELGVLMRDGRLRDGSKMMYLPAGADTPALFALLRALHRGVTRTALLAQAAELDIGFDDELLDELLARRVVEPGPAPTLRPDADGICWLGHAFVTATHGGHRLWVDPFPAPRIRWDADERQAMFSGDVPDTFLLADYGPDAHHVTQDQLPLPDAVFVTHQDVDHMDLGALGLLPPATPIYVPAADPACPWQVDLVHALRTVLGPDRNVIVLRHGERIQIGAMRVTAMPFVGEFPTMLPHAWNNYLIELPDQAWALMADGAVTSAHVALLRELRRDDPRPLGLMINNVPTNPVMQGYADAPTEPANIARLYPWFVPPAELGAPAPNSGAPPAILAALVAEAGLRLVYPYAHGNLPWYRLDGSYVLQSHVGSHTLEIFEWLERVVEEAGARVVRLRHGEAFAPSPALLESIRAAAVARRTSSPLLSRS